MHKSRSAGISHAEGAHTQCVTHGSAFLSIMGQKRRLRGFSPSRSGKSQLSAMPKVNKYIQSPTDKGSYAGKCRQNR